MRLDEFFADLATRAEWSHLTTITAHARGSHGDTPLHAAIYADDNEAAQLLIAAGADVNAVGEDAYTPLHAAIVQTNVALAKKLTERGASWDAVNKFECSVREAARRSDDPGVKALFEQEQQVSMLPGSVGHFRLESGHHSDLWLDLPRLCVVPELVRQRAAILAARLAPHHVEVICGPLVEGAYVALLVALDLGATFTYAERIAPTAGDDRLFAVRYVLPNGLRGQVRGKRVAIVNDVVSAGSAVRGTLDDLKACGATVVAIGTLAVLGASMPAFAEGQGIAFESVASFAHNLWPPAECPLCTAGVPLTTIPTDGAPPA